VRGRSEGSPDDRDRLPAAGRKSESTTTGAAGPRAAADDASGVGRKRRGSRRATVQVTRLDVAVGQSMVLPAPGKVPGNPSSSAAGGSPTAQPTGAAEPTAAPSPEPRQRSGLPQGILPDKAAEDLDAVWGGSAGNPERDDWLKEQRPPHWD